jgi:hypothetical protein
VDDLGEGQVNILFLLRRVILVWMTNSISGTGTGVASTRQVLLR